MLKMVITSEIVCRTGTLQGEVKKNNVSIPRETGKSTIVTHGTIRVNRSNPQILRLNFFVSKINELTDNLLRETRLVFIVKAMFLLFCTY